MKIKTYIGNVYARHAVFIHKILSENGFVDIDDESLNIYMSCTLTPDKLYSILRTIEEHCGSDYEEFRFIIDLAYEENTFKLSDEQVIKYE